MRRLLYFVKITSGDAEYIYPRHIDQLSLHSSRMLKAKMGLLFLFLITMPCLCLGHTFTDHLAGSTTNQIPRMTLEMTISVVRYGCTTQVLLRIITDAIRKSTD